MEKEKVIHGGCKGGKKRTEGGQGECERPKHENRTHLLKREGRENREYSHKGGKRSKRKNNV